MCQQPERIAETQQFPGSADAGDLIANEAGNGSNTETSRNTMRYSYQRIEPATDLRRTGLVLQPPGRGERAQRLTVADPGRSGARNWPFSSHSFGA